MHLSKSKTTEKTTSEGIRTNTRKRRAFLSVAAVALISCVIAAIMIVVQKAEAAPISVSTRDEIIHPDTADYENWANYEYVSDEVYDDFDFSFLLNDTPISSNTNAQWYPDATVWDRTQGTATAETTMCGWLLHTGNDVNESQYPLAVGSREGYEMPAHESHTLRNLADNSAGNSNEYNLKIVGVCHNAVRNTLTGNTYDIRITIGKFVWASCRGTNGGILQVKNSIASLMFYKNNKKIACVPSVAGVAQADIQVEVMNPGCTATTGTVAPKRTLFGVSNAVNSNNRRQIELHNFGSGTWLPNGDDYKYYEAGNPADSEINSSGWLQLGGDITYDANGNSKLQRSFQTNSSKSSFTEKIQKKYLIGDSTTPENATLSNSNAVSSMQHEVSFGTVQFYEGTLTVSKAVDDPDPLPNQTFQFEVTIDNLRNIESVVLGGVTYTEGVAQFSLEADGSKVLANLPVGAEEGADYTVREIPSSIYRPSWSGTCSPDPAAANTATGTLARGQDETASVLNTRLTGKVKITKHTVGDGADASKEFQFALTLKNGNQPVSGTFGGFRFNEQGRCEFSLSDGGEREFTGIPAGYSYEFSEEMSDTAYIPSWSGGRTGIVSADANANVTATNTYMTGGLSISKVVSGPGTHDMSSKAFQFSVKLYDPNQNDAQVMSGTFGSHSIQNGAISLSISEENSPVTITGIPEGLHYEVTETLPSGEEGYWRTSWTHKEGTIGDASISVVANNTRFLGNLVIQKDVVREHERTNDDPNRRFEFSITLKDDEGNNVNGQFGGLMFNDGVATTYVTEDEPKVIRDIPTGYTYEITEVTEGISGRYTTSYDSKKTGTIGFAPVEG